MAWGLATALVLAVVLPLTLSAGGRPSAFPGGVSPGRIPTRLAPDSPSSGQAGSSSTSSVSGSTTTIVAARPSSASATAGQSGSHTKPTTLTTQVSPPDTAPAAFSWHEQTVPNGVGILKSVSCPDSGHCWAAGGNVVVATSNSGSGWTVQQIPPLGSNDQLIAISCVDDSTCWTESTHRMFHTIDGGSTWTEQTIPPAAFGHGGFFTGLTCVDQMDCMAVGVGQNWIIVATTSGGLYWGVSTLCGLCTMNAITCVNTSICWVGGVAGTSSQYPNYPPAIWVTRDGGNTWTPQTIHLTTGEQITVVQSISCSNSQDCTAVGHRTGTPGLILSTTDGGANWNQVVGPGGTIDLFGVSCIPTTSCWAFGNGIVITRPDTGASWIIQFQTSSAWINGIDCVNTGQCWAVGYVSSTTSPPGAIFART